MKNLILTCSVVFMTSIAIASVDYVPLADLVLENPSRFDRPAEVTRVPLAGLAVPIAAAEHARLGVWADGVPVPCTVTSGSSPELLVLVGLAGGESKRLSIGIAPGGSPVSRLEVQRTWAEISRKFGGKWEDNKYLGGEFRNVLSTTTPPEHTDHSWFYRYEGPGWESDRVAYRLYLDWRNGIDVFAKRVSGMVLPGVGLDGFDSYHEPADWGMDILKVGGALGIGGFGHWDGEKAVRVSEVDAVTCTITRNDGLVSGFRNEYHNWDFGKGPADLEAVFEIAAGSYLTEVTLRSDNDDLQAVTGLPKHEGIEVFRGSTSEGNVTIPNASWSYLATYGPQSLDGAMLGMVVFFQGGHFDGFAEDAHNFLVRLDPRAGTVQYRFGALWEVSAPAARSREGFLQYLEATVDRLNKQVRVRVNPVAREAFIGRHDPLREAAFYGENLAGSVVARRGRSLSFGSFDPESGLPAKWRYTTGLMAGSLYLMGSYTGNDALRDFGIDTISSFVSGDGSIATYAIDEYNIDKINSGKMLLELYALTGEARYMRAAENLLKQLEEHPRTSGGAFWHKQIYPWQVWLDGVYMAAPFYARAGLMMEHPLYIDEVVKEFRIVHRELRDPETGLYYHGWDESKAQSWADPQTGLSREFWGRGIGWYAMALVDTLDYLGEESDDHAFLVGVLNELAEALARYQDPGTGVWWQVVDRAGELGNYREASASSMFVYAMAKGLNRGYLPGKFGENVRRGYAGLVNEFIEVDADGLLSLRDICQVAGLGYGREGTYDYYITEPLVKNDAKGVGPFILASIEVDKWIHSR